MKHSILITSLLLAGCGFCKLPAPEIVTKIVEVPVPVKCEIEPIDKPQLYFDQAKKDNKLFNNTALLAAENETLTAYNIKLEAALKGCTK